MVVLSGKRYYNTVTLFFKFWERINEVNKKAKKMD